MAIMGGGFGAILVWMYLTMYSANGIGLENEGYIFAMVNSLDQDASDKTAGASDLDAGAALIARMKAELAKSGIEVETSEDEAASDKDMTEKERLLESIRITYGKGADQEEWNGSGYQVMAWHYEKSLGRYFNNPEEIEPMVETLKIAINVVFIGIALAMALLLFGARKNGGLLYWLLVIVPIALPVFFVIEYSAWLYWFGHELNDMGAFTVKPFMPTVFGQGKVAQFTTHSYPYYGFGLMLLFSAVLAVAALVRRKQFKEG